MSKSNHHVYLLIGQSNMAGRAPIREKDTNPPRERSFLLDISGEWVRAEPPMNWYSTIRKGEDKQKLCPAGSFTREMEEKKAGVSFGLVVNARGGTKVGQWQKGGDYYDEAVRRTLQAMETGVLKAILWHQGESDAENENYVDTLAMMINDFRLDFGDDSIPFIAGELLQEEGLMTFNERLATLPDIVEHTAVVSSEGCERIVGDRHPHFDTESQRIMGVRYAEAVIEMVYGGISSIKSPTTHQPVRRIAPSSDDAPHAINGARAPSRSTSSPTPLVDPSKGVILKIRSSE
ncbi:MAG: sialate O-acetylesterase [Chitinivibrionales bacterium]|nr:sialate O-acetylesterase [Chitinivibrionales bacterium]MBD3357938.1 sialate O-acetylesterase [Chitinivibrionales bacterium]